MPDAQQRKIWKRQATAITQLGPCSNEAIPWVCKDKKSSGSGPSRVHARSTQPTWDFQTVHVSRQRHKQADDVHTQGRLGQAVLSLPLSGADVAIGLPPGLQLTATAAGSLDCRLQLLSLTADWPVFQQQLDAAGDDGRMPQLIPAQSPTAGFVCRSGALLLAHALFPEHTHGLLNWLAVPVAVADAVAAVGSAVPAPARRAVAVRAGKLKDRLQGSGSRAACSGDSSSWGSDGYITRPGVGFVDGAAGVAGGAIHVMRCLSGPAAALASAGWLWNVLHPSSHTLCSCLVALMAVAADYSQLGREVSRGKHGTGKQVEAAWHARHKAAAQRLAMYCGDLPATPPLQPLLHIASCCSIAAGLAIDGQPLSGLTAPGLTAAGAAAVSGAGSSGAQLLVSASVHAPTDGSSCGGQGKVNQAAGLSRSQLLELFTGSAEEAAAAAACSGDSPAAAAAAAAAASSWKSDVEEPAIVASPQEQEQEQLQLQLVSCATAGAGCQAEGLAGAAAGCINGADPLAFLETLDLYGQADHSGDSAALLASPDQPGWLLDAMQLGLRAVYLLLVFAPFLLLGIPMLLVAWYLLSRAAAAQQQQQGQPPNQASNTNSRQRQTAAGEGSTVGCEETAAAAEAAAKMDVVTIISPEPGDVSVRSLVNGSWPADMLAGWQQLARTSADRLTAAMCWLLQQLLLLTLRLAALLDLLLVLLLGGQWSAGVSAWESAGLFLRKRAWRLLLFSCASAGAAFIKWGQWSASRRDIFPEDFCDVLSALHDRAPVHSFRHSKRLVEAAFGVKLEQLFETFDPKPLASGSIAQVHRALLRSDYRNSCSTTCSSSGANKSSSAVDGQQQQQCNQPAAAGGCSPGASGCPAAVRDVVVKVNHPSVAKHICLDFRLLTALSAALARIPALKGLSLRQSVAQFSHTMTAQTDLRVEATHALRFSNNFSGVRSSVRIPRPIPGLVTQQVLVETFEAGRSVAAFMKETTAINTQIVALGVDAFLKMLLVDNFVHTDLHPGNILFREVRAHYNNKKQQQQRQQQDQQRQQQQQQRQGPLQRRWWQLWHKQQRQQQSQQGSSSSSCDQPAAPAQWEVELQQMAAAQQQRWTKKHTAATVSSPSWSQPQQQQEQQQDQGHGSAAGAAGDVCAQLVLLDFGLAEQLSREVRHHFISFLNAIASGDGLAAARHLLRWSHQQTCEDPRAFTRDVIDLFDVQCDIQSKAGIDLDAVMKAVLGLARKHYVSIDSCYASLVISVCVLVGFAKALDPEVNLLDAATPTLLAYSMTGKVVGRLYS